MQELRKIIKQVCTNSGRQVPWSAKFCAAVPYICGSAVWNFLHIAHLTPRILWWLLDGKFVHLWYTFAVIDTILINVTSGE